MTDVEADRTLSSKSRLDILKLFYRNALSVGQIAEKFSLQPITVRHARLLR